MEKQSNTMKGLAILTMIIVILIFLLPLNLGGLNSFIALLIVIVSSVIQFKKGALKSLGFQREQFTFKNLLIYAPIISILLIGIYIFILSPLVIAITQQNLDLSYFAPLKGNLPALLTTLPIVWLTAAFGEEIIFRGYLMRQFSRLFGESKLSLIINIILFSLVFGFAHGYQGISGQILNSCVGALLALIFHIKKYNLWLNVFIHGIVDTIALTGFYFGWLL